MRKTLLLLALMGSLNVMADSITVSKLRHIGPFAVKSPVLIDSVDNAQKKFCQSSTIPNAATIFSSIGVPLS